MTSNDERRGYISALISYTSVGFGFIGMNFMIEASSVFTAQIIFFLTGAITSLAILFFQRGDIRLHSLKRNWKSYSLACLLMAYVATSTFISIDLIGPEPVSFVNQMGVVFGVMLGALVLGEKFGLLDGLGGFLAIAGAFIMSYGPGEYMKLGILLVLGSSFALAVHNLVIKRHSAEIDKLELLFIRAVTTFMAVSLLALFTGGIEKPPIWMIPLGALTSFVGFMMVNFFRYTALHYINMSKESMLRVIAPVLVAVLSFFIYNSIPDSLELIGSVMILLGVSLILFQPLFNSQSMPAQNSKC